MSWITDIVDPQTRQWEEFYRNRWQHDKVVRSTHGVNCTGGCSWGGLPARYLGLVVCLQPHPGQVPVYARRAGGLVAPGAAET
jgi:hypothetical protein